MSSPSVARTGSQKPRIETRPKFANEAAGVEAIELAESVGLHLDPWQQHIVRVALAESEDGRYAASEVGFLVARQNGKGGALEAIALHGLFLVEDPLTLWTAHQFKTSSEAFLRMKGWIEGSDDLRRRVKRIVSAHGEEGFELVAGPRLRFLARSKSSGRGFSPQRIIFDEAQELAKVAAEAMLPSMRAQWNRQAIFTGTVPGPEINNPEHWTRVRDRGRRGESRLAWMEWSPKDSEDPEKAPLLDLSNHKVWLDANPGVGFREGLTVETIEADHAALDLDSFSRECASVWPTMQEINLDALFGTGMWQSCAVDIEPPRPAALGIAVSIGRDHASIGAASSGDCPHLGSVVRAPGVAWVVTEAKRLQKQYACPVVLDEKGPAESLIEDLRAAGVKVTTVSTDEYLGACANLFDLVQRQGVSHGNYTDLNAAVGSAQKRIVSDRFAWGRKSGDVSMLEAVTLALHGTATPVRDFWGAVG